MRAASRLLFLGASLGGCLLSNGQTLFSTTSAEVEECPLIPSCCEEDCCGPGTSWDQSVKYCVLDPASNGFDGTYSDDFERGCVLRVCCEVGCCTEGMTFDPETAFCVPIDTGKTTTTDPPTVSPTAADTPSPTVSPTAAPDTPAPTPAPTSEPQTDPPTASPTAADTPSPTANPTAAPDTPAPTAADTPSPTANPTDALDTPVPTPAPTSEPQTDSPTSSPTTEPTASATAAQAPVILSALEDFVAVQDDDLVPFYKDDDRQALAIDAREYKDMFSGAETVYDGNDGTFTVVVTALTETDGESTYKLLVNGIEIGLAQNPESSTDYEPANHSFENVALKNGDTIQVRFNSVSNGKIPEGNGFAYSRGRWTTLTINSGESSSGRRLRGVRKFSRLLGF